MTTIYETAENQFVQNFRPNVFRDFVVPHEPIRVIMDPDALLEKSAEVFDFDGLTEFEDNLHDLLPPRWLRAKDSKELWKKRKPLGELFTKKSPERLLGRVTLCLIDDPQKLIHQHNENRQLLKPSFTDRKRFNLSKFTQFLGYHLSAEIIHPHQDNEQMYADVFYAPAGYRALTEGQALLRLASRIDKSC